MLGCKLYLAEIDEGTKLYCIFPLSQFPLFLVLYAGFCIRTFYCLVDSTVAVLVIEVFNYELNRNIKFTWHYQRLRTTDNMLLCLLH